MPCSLEKLWECCMRFQVHDIMCLQKAQDTIAYFFQKNTKSVTKSVTTGLLGMQQARCVACF
jgi:hypothetical protein